MDKVVQKLVALGIPGLVLLAVMATSGMAGGAAILVALSTLGGPLGILGGIAVLGILALVCDALAEYGFQKIAGAVVRGLVANGTSKAEIRRTVNGYRLVSKATKRMILAEL